MMNLKPPLVISPSQSPPIELFDLIDVRWERGVDPFFKIGKAPFKATSLKPMDHLYHEPLMTIRTGWVGKGEAGQFRAFAQDEHTIKTTLLLEQWSQCLDFPSGLELISCPLCQDKGHITHMLSDKHPTITTHCYVCLGTRSVVFDRYEGQGREATIIGRCIPLYSNDSETAKPALRTQVSPTTL